MRESVLATQFYVPVEMIGTLFAVLMGLLMRILVKQNAKMYRKNVLGNVPAVIALETMIQFVGSMEILLEINVKLTAPR